MADKRNREDVEDLVPKIKKRVAKAFGVAVSPTITIHGNNLGYYISIACENADSNRVRALIAPDFEYKGVPTYVHGLARIQGH